MLKKGSKFESPSKWNSHEDFNLGWIGPQPIGGQVIMLEAIISKVPTTYPPTLTWTLIGKVRHQFRITVHRIVIPNYVQFWRIKSNRQLVKEKLWRGELLKSKPQQLFTFEAQINHIIYISPYQWTAGGGTFKLKTLRQLPNHFRGIYGKTERSQHVTGWAWTH
jgi:hypothetical protein